MKNSVNHVRMPSDVRNFRMVVDTFLKLLSDVDPSIFYSPYSVIPVLSQSMGLNTPLMGSGNSPYSIISFVQDLYPHKEHFDALFSLPLIEKRRIVDEIYEMIAPALLGEQDTFIELMATTTCRQLKNIPRFKRDSGEKFAILMPLINRFRRQKGGFGYVVHYGYPEDIYREYSFLEKMPPRISSAWGQGSFPVVNEIVLNDFPTYRNQTEKSLHGWLIFITNYTKQMLYDGKLRTTKIRMAALLAKALGARLLGMGGLIASFAQGGNWLSDELEGMGITTGHAYTIGNIMQITDAAADSVGLGLDKATVAIVGAAGSIGSGCAKMIALYHPREIMLVELSTFNAQQRLDEIRTYISGIDNTITVTFTETLQAIRKADIVIVATNSPTSIIKAAYLKPGAIVIDDSFPKNVPRTLLDRRKDVILLEGGVMQLPPRIEILSARNMPDLMDAPLTRAISCKETYGCFAELIVLALYRHQQNYGLGVSDPSLAHDILAKAKKVGIGRAPLQCFDETVERQRLHAVARIIKSTHNAYEHS